MQKVLFLKPLFVLWALPCSIIGFSFGMILLLLGGKIKFISPAFEISFPKYLVPRNSRFTCITFGNIILGLTTSDLNRLRNHEHQHVKQYYYWGIFFFPAYLLSSIYLFIIGKSAYQDNYFEVQARKNEE